MFDWPSVHFFDGESGVVLVLEYGKSEAWRILGHPDLLEVAKLAEGLLHVVLRDGVRQIGDVYAAEVLVVGALVATRAIAAPIATSTPVSVAVTSVAAATPRSSARTTAATIFATAVRFVLGAYYAVFGHGHHAPVAAAAAHRSSSLVVKRAGTWMARRSRIRALVVAWHSFLFWVYSVGSCFLFFFSLII